MPTSTSPFGHPPSTIRLGDLEVQRLGYGAMRLPGPGVWGEPKDPDRARAVLRRVVELGINFIDTSWYYGPFVSNRLIAETLYPYPAGLVIATKLGGRRTPDKGWAPYLRPEQLREGCEHDLKGLRLDRLDVVHLRHIGGSDVPFLESLDALIALQQEGKIRHIALSNVNVAQIEAARARTPIVAVQNMYTVSGGGGEAARMAHAEVEDPEGVLRHCEAMGIAFLPFFPLAMGKVESAHRGLVDVARRRGVTPAQVSIAYLLAHARVMLPIPGTSQVGHLDENWGARLLRLEPEDLETLRS